MSNLLTRAAVFEPSTYNAESGTVNVIFSTGADVQRRDHLGPFLERLSMIPADWELSARRGAPVLDHHNRASVHAVLGVVEQAAIEGGRGVAVVRFGTRPEVRGIAADVAAGIIRQTSIGYTVREWTDSTEGNVRVRTARGIKPLELSFTAIGADPGATTRSTGGSMDLNQIRTLAVGLGVPPEFADTLVQRNLPDAELRREMVAEASRRLPQIDPRRPAEVSPITEPEALVRAAGEALYSRFNPTFQPSEMARQFAGRRFADIARSILLLRNHNTLGSDAEVITRAGLHATGDLSNLLGTLAGKVLAASYQSAPSGLKTVCRRGAPHNDFKGRNVLRRGELPTLETVAEGGEITRGTITDGKNSYSIVTKAKIFAITRQALVNDDLGAFADVAAGWGSAAAETENGVLVSKLTENNGTGPTLGDSVVLFHSSHGNVAGSGGAISDTTLGAARLAMRVQKGLNGTTPISATPNYLVVPAALETTAEKYLSTIYPAQAANVNPFGGTNRLELVVDARLDAVSATRWYLFADPAILPVIEYAYLAGAEGVQIETRAGFEVDGVEIKARLDFGCGGVDHRGAYTNAGA